MALEIVQVPVLADNYVYLIHDSLSGLTAVVDPAVAKAPLKAAGMRGWAITHILNTHHHPDHVGGNLEIKAATGCTIVGPAYDKDRIPGIDIEVSEEEPYRFGETEAEIFFIPGHTRGHIAYWFKDDNALFVGDTLFALGCGRLFEGTAEQMWHSLSKFRAVPDDTLVYCAHEYTQANAKFALTVETDNAALKARAREIDAMRAADRPTVPSTMGVERETNPFLRADLDSMRRAVGMEGAAPAEVFGEIRSRKDNF